MPIIKLLTKRQEAELVTAIQGRAEIPLKFAYLGEGAYNWDKIAGERSEGEGINSAEGALLKKKVKDFLAAVDTKKGVNIIDIGVVTACQSFPYWSNYTLRKFRLRTFRWISATR